MQKWFVLPACLVAAVAVVSEAHAEDLRVQQTPQAEAAQLTRQGTDGDHQRNPLTGQALVTDEAQIRDLQYRVHLMATGFRDLQGEGPFPPEAMAGRPSTDGTFQARVAGWHQTSWLDSGVTQIPAPRKRVSLGEIRAALAQPGETPTQPTPAPIARLETPPALEPLPGYAGAELRQALQAPPRNPGSTVPLRNAPQATASRSRLPINDSAPATAPTPAAQPVSRPVTSVASIPSVRVSTEGSGSLRSVTGKERAGRMPRPGNPPELAGVPAEDLMHPRMQRQLTEALDWYQGRAKTVARMAITRKARMSTELTPALTSVGVPTWVLGVAAVESGMNPAASPGSTYTGMWQMSPDSARSHGLKVSRGNDQRLDAGASSRAAGRMLSFLYKRYQNWPLALAAYNVGYGRVDRALKARPGADLAALVEAGLLPTPCLVNVAKYLTMGQILEFPELYGFYNPLEDAQGNRRESVAIVP